MSKKLMILTVRGKQSSWMFETTADPQYLAEWQADGLDIHIIENSIPAFAAEWPHVWCFLQDLFNFRNPWRK